MEIQATTAHPAPRPVGDAVPGMAAGEDTHTLAGFLVCHHREPGDAYFLHGHAARPLLDRAHGHWSGVSELPVSSDESNFFFFSSRVTYLLPQSEC